jgi:hypothetical protein
MHLERGTDWYYQSKSIPRSWLGPITAEALLELLNKGEVTLDTFVRNDTFRAASRRLRDTDLVPRWSRAYNDDAASAPTGTSNASDDNQANEPISAGAAREGWFFEERGKRCGPVAAGQLRSFISSGRITNNTLVWHPSIGGAWRPMSEANLEIAGNTPPPLPISPVTSSMVKSTGIDRPMKMTVLPLIGLAIALGFANSRFETSMIRENLPGWLSQKGINNLTIDKVSSDWLGIIDGHHEDLVTFKETPRFLKVNVDGRCIFECSVSTETWTWASIVLAHQSGKLLNND